MIFAKYPLFERISSPKHRVLTAIAIGTDYYLSGVPKVGVKIISDHLDSIYKNNRSLSDDEAFDLTMKMLVTRLKKERDK